MIPVQFKYSCVVSAHTLCVRCRVTVAASREIGVGRVVTAARVSYHQNIRTSHSPKNNILPTPASTPVFALQPRQLDQIVSALAIATSYCGPAIPTP